jgi:hypothetical protein
MEKWVRYPDRPCLPGVERRRARAQAEDQDHGGAKGPASSGGIAGTEVDIMATPILPGGYRIRLVMRRSAGGRKALAGTGCHVWRSATIRGTDLWWFGFDGLEPVDSSGRRAWRQRAFR